MYSISLMLQRISPLRLEGTTFPAQSTSFKWDLHGFTVDLLSKRGWQSCNFSTNFVKLTAFCGNVLGSLLLGPPFVNVRLEVWFRLNLVKPSKRCFHLSVSDGLKCAVREFSDFLLCWTTCTWTSSYFESTPLDCVCLVRTMHNVNSLSLCSWSVVGQLCQIYDDDKTCESF